MGRIFFAILGGLLTVNSFLLEWLLPGQEFASKMSALFGAFVLAFPIIITAITDIGSYDVVLSDLYAGEHKYAKENVLVYNQKYIELNEITNGQSAVLPTGDWPDALLPFETAKAAGENNVEAGRNQGIYFEFHIPAETAAGVYSGTFAVEYDGKTQEIPVRLCYPTQESSYNSVHYKEALERMGGSDSWYNHVWWDVD